MLEILRNATGGIVAKIFIGLLVASFAVWGIADIFIGGQSTAVVTVGKTEISSYEYQRVFRLELRALSRRLGRNIDLMQARALGLDRRVLSRLVGQAAIDNQVIKLGLKLGDQTIADRIAATPAFRDNSGKFNRSQFEDVLFQNGLSEGEFVASQRTTLLRDQIGRIIETGVEPPEFMLKTLFNFQAEKRQVTFFAVPASAAKTAAKPSDSDISTYYNAHKSEFKAPEYRKITILSVQPSDVANSIDISAVELKEAYEERKDQFEILERREVLQIVFPTKVEADTARTGLTTLEDFKALAKKRGLTDADLSLGVVTKAGMPDSKISTAAFSLAENKISDVVEGDLATALLYVKKIYPGGITPFEEVREKLKSSLALDRAQDEILSLHDAIEDERAGGATLEETAKKLALKFLDIDAIDRAGRDRTGNPITELPITARLMPVIFRGEVGVEIDPIETEIGGYIWVNIQKVTAVAEKTLEEARPDVVIKWKEAAVQKNLTAYSAKLLERLSSGESFLKVASSIGSKVQQSKPMGRFDSSDGLSAAAVTKIFLTDRDKVSTTTANNSAAQIIFKVTDVATPAYDSTTTDVKALTQQIKSSIGTNLMSQYETALREKTGVTVNQRIWSEISGNTGTASPI